MNYFLQCCFVNNNLQFQIPFLNINTKKIIVLILINIFETFKLNKNYIHVIMQSVRCGKSSLLL